MLVSRLPHLLLIVVLSIASGAFALRAAEPAPAPAPVANYQVATDPANIAPTVATRTASVPVTGKPVVDAKHPNIFWDQSDIDHYKEMLKTNKELQVQLEILQKKMDAVIAEPLDRPLPQKGADGNWQFPGEFWPSVPGYPDDTAETKFRRHYAIDSQNASDLGTLYALTGDEKYANYAKQIIMAYAHCNEWGGGKNIRLRSAQGIAVQLLEETLIMDHFVRSYDLIYNLPSWTADERKQLHDDFFFPMACVYLYPAGCDNDKEGGGSFCSQLNNRGLIGLTSVLAMGYVSDDQQLIDAGLYGIHSKLEKPDQAELTHFPPRQDWVAGTKDNPGHGLLNTYFSETLMPGGMWVEGTPSYAIYVLGSMVDAAEICWHHGIDLYSQNNAIFKNMFDFPLLMSYPDLTTPGLNDAHRDTLLEGATPTLYEYGYRRYQDPRYLTMINPQSEKDYLAALSNPDTEKAIIEAALAPPPPKTPPPAPTPDAAPAGDATAATPPAAESTNAPAATPPAPGATNAATATAPADAPKLPKPTRHLELAKIGSVPPAFMYDLDPNATATVPLPPSVNYEQVGYGILRTPTLDGKSVQSVILAAGPTASHGHPDKLQIDLYALDDVLIPSPGVIFPYNNPMDAKWFHTTIAHNTLCVDEKSQEYFGNNPRSKARADQLIFAPASTVGMQRAWTCSVYPGVTMDRSVFMTSEYMADIFGAFSSAPHKYDLSWHIKGDVGADVNLTPVSLNQSEIGYNVLTNIRGADVPDKPWTVTLTRGDKVARLHATAGPATQAIVADGGIVVDNTATPTHRPPVPTIIQRRENTASTIYGNVLDFSNSKDGYVKDVAQEGSLDVGYAALKITTTVGTDICFTSYRPGSYSAGGGLQTDAMQAFVRMAGSNPETLYLAGGKTLKAGNASIDRSVPGLAYVEKTAEGNYIVGNPSTSEATVTVTLPALSGLDPFTLDASGKKGTAPVNVTKSGSTVTVPLPAGGMVGFFKK